MQTARVPSASLPHLLCGCVLVFFCFALLFAYTCDLLLQRAGQLQQELDAEQAAHAETSGRLQGLVVQLTVSYLFLVPWQIT